MTKTCQNPECGKLLIQKDGEVAWGDDEHLAELVRKNLMSEAQRQSNVTMRVNGRHE